MKPASTQLQHALLLSDSAAFHEKFERALRVYSPALLISRIHPDGAFGMTKTLLSTQGAARSLLVIDYDRPKPIRKPEMWALIRAWTSEGCRALLCTEISPKIPQLASHPEAEIDLLGCSSSWSQHQLADCIQCVLVGRGFMSESPVPKLISGGEALIASSRQKGEFLDSLSDSLVDSEVQRTKRGKIVTLVDELLMNAIYDAPANSRGSRLYKNIGTRLEVELDPGKKVRARWTLRPEEFRITVCDPYGSLAPGVFMKKLSAFLTQKQAQPTQESGGGGSGAGVGLFMALRNVRSFSTYVVADSFTEVSATLDMPPFTDRSRRNKEIFFYFGSQRSL